MGNATDRIIYIFLILVVLLSIANIGLVFSQRAKVQKASRIAQQPAKLQLISITADCPDCADVGMIVQQIKRSNANITSEKSLSLDSKEAKELIERYNITKLPTVIVQGEINRTFLQGFGLKEDALVFEGQGPPYFDVKAGKVVGRVVLLMLVDNTCKFCQDPAVAVENLNKSKVSLSEVRKLDYKSSEASDLIKKLGIKKVPALLISQDIDFYPIAQNLKQAGLKVVAGFYVVEGQPPYVEVESGKLRGLVKLTLLNDSSCSECYDVGIHRQVLERLGIYLSEEKTFDILSKEGKELLNAYNITKVPTILLTGDLAAYEGFSNLWLQVGSIEPDGTHIFREMSALSGIFYKDLSSGKIVKALPADVSQEQSQVRIE
ncbi:MAG: hypothetical protein QXU88_00120 [Candidatus Woesearchaeota archaeon]